MLVVCFGVDGQLEKEYHCGDKGLREILRDASRAEGLYSVYADCNELEHINSYYEGIFKAPNARTCEWTGETARFILANWRE